MPGIAVFGAQWGDEGKGRFVDFLADYYSQTEDGIGKLKALWSTTRYLFRPSAGQFFEWRDPMPGLYVFYRMAKQKLSQARLVLSNKLRLSTAL